MTNLHPVFEAALAPFMPNAWPGLAKPASKLDRHTPTFYSHVAGIPCGIKVDRCFVQKPLGPRADSDWDCDGYSDIEFTVLDNSGYEAPWLQRKLTDDDTTRIEEYILAMNEEV